MMHCKICETQSSFFFSTKVLNKYDVDYFQCPSCGFVQTEDPYWLEEAYSSPITASDIGILMRNEMLVQLAGNIIVTFFDHDAKFLDYGAGYGLFVRMMRDRGVNFSWNDHYCSNLFSSGFEASLGEPFELVTSFEVFEHLVNPVETIEQLLTSSRNILFSTELLPPGNPVGEDWWYYAPHEGQHISIFTLDSLEHIAVRFGLHLHSNGSFFHLLTEKKIDPQEFIKWCQYVPAGFGKQSLLQQDVVTLANKATIANHTHELEETWPEPRRSKPTIIIDGMFFQVSSTGITRVWTSLLNEWAKTEFSEHIVVLDRIKTMPRIPGITYRDVPAYSYDNVEKDREILQSICDEEQASIFISTYYTIPLTTPCIFMAHDMIPEIMSWDLNHPMWVGKQQSINYAAAYISVSKNTARDLSKFLPDIDLKSIPVFYNAINHDTFKTALPDVIDTFKAAYNIQKPYFLLVGHRTGYKNTILFFNAFSKVADRSNFDVICVGPSLRLEPELAAAIDGYNVRNLKLSDEELQSAYSGAIALVYPSKYEGFGLPVLEAMACSCPVITCSVSAIPEVAGDAAIFVDMDDTEDMICAIYEIQKVEVRQDLIRKGLVQSQKFSWPQTASALSSWLLTKSQDFQSENIKDLEFLDSFSHILEKAADLDSQTDLTIIADMRILRSALASHYAGKPQNYIKLSQNGVLGDVYKKVIEWKKVLDFNLDDMEFVSVLAPQREGRRSISTVNNLIVKSLYQRSYDIDSPPKIAEIPIWFLPSYLDFVFSTPQVFCGEGDIDRCISTVGDYLSDLQKTISRDIAPGRFDQAVWMTCQKLAKIPSYFGSGNTREYFKCRAALIEYYLSSKGYNLQHEFEPSTRGNRKVRLGILAAHFAPQSETFASLPVYQTLNRNDFEITLIYLSQDDHRLERYCFGQADANVQLPKGLNAQVNCIRDLDLDILFIASNVTLVLNEMALLAAHRMGRIQVVGMNSPTSVGFENIDYYLSSSLVDTSFSLESHYTERLLKLDCAAQCFDFATERFLQTDASITRVDLNILDEMIVYCTGANARKITPELEKTWAKIIASVPNSVLMLYPFNPNWSENYPVDEFRSRISQTFIANGIDLSRLIILDQTPTRAGVVDRLKIVDIYLDSYPFSGMTSLLDPLMLNIPTLVMEMDSVCSLARGAAFLRELKATELIVQDETSYLDLAIKLGQDSSLRYRMKSVIRDGMAEHPSFLNSDRYGVEITRVFKEIFADYQSAEYVKNLPVGDQNLIVFPDWTLDENQLFESVLNPVRIVINDPNHQQTSLLVYIGEQDPEYADLLLNSVLIHLVTEEGLEVQEDGPQVEFLDHNVMQSSVQLSAMYKLLEFDGQDSVMVRRFNEC
jgi:predicted O-linked N-acetylglucosamine transferase (SPINDLY family)/glycosyltransferase involved in cell wall biosynthesis